MSWKHPASLTLLTLCLSACGAPPDSGTVHVAPGVYTEHVRLKSGIRLSSLGAPYTFLDAQGASRSLIDFTGATDVVITGFTFRNVGPDTWCTISSDMDRWCASEWYAAAISADGHEPTSALIENNIFDHNGIVVLLYFHARAEQPALEHYLVPPWVAGRASSVRGGCAGVPASASGFFPSLVPTRVFIRSATT